MVVPPSRLRRRSAPVLSSAFSAPFGANNSIKRLPARRGLFGRAALFIVSARGRKRFDRAAKQPDDRCSYAADYPEGKAKDAAANSADWFQNVVRPAAGHVVQGKQNNHN